MRAGYKKIPAFLIAGVMMLLVLSGCVIGTKEEKNIPPLSSAWLSVYDGNLELDFTNNTVTYKQYDGETHQSDVASQTELNGDDAAQYKEIVTAMCRDMIDNEAQYLDGPVHGELVHSAWSVWYFFEDGSERRMNVVEGSTKQYPDNWDEFVSKTNELTGLDVDELMLEPVPKEIEDLHQAVFYLPDGLVSINYAESKVEFFGYSTETEVIKELSAEKMAEGYDFMMQFCEEMLAHQGEYTGTTTETEPEIYWELDIHYNEGKMRPIYVTSNGEKKYPDNWDELAKLVSDFTGQDINELLTGTLD